MAQFPAEEAKGGEYKRQEDAFRDWVKCDGSTLYPAGSAIAIIFMFRWPVPGRIAPSFCAN